MLDFQHEDLKQRRSDEPFNRQLKKIAERDLLIQQARSERGGVMTSALTEEGEAASVAVIRRRDAAKAALARPVIAAARAKQARLVREGAELARKFLAVRAAIATHEHNANTYCAAVGEAALPTFAGRDTDAAEFLARVERHEVTQTATASRVTARQPPPQPDFADLVAS
jgi:hypothetical protein